MIDRLAGKAIFSNKLAIELLEGSSISNNTSDLLYETCVDIV